MDNSRQTDPLDARLIRESMAPAMQARLLHLTLLRETDSTNTTLQNMPGHRQHAHAVLADCQTGGRGRRQKSWHSPAGGNVYLSLGWRFRKTGWPLSTLPLVVAIAVCRALARTGLEGHGIKWPNDILVKGKKLAGILVELNSPGAGPALAIIGVGLNVRMPPASKGTLSDVIDRPWTDLASEMKTAFLLASRNRLAALLLEELLAALEDYQSNGFPVFSSAWQELDLLQGRSIRLEHNGEQISGEAQGVDASGGLLLKTVSSGIQVFHSGEVSVYHD
jgi:BirA family biotin operon repressor/biotin-[acetyl-CoA-carboxylase] ligase